MKKILTWIVLCNILLMGLNVVLLFSKNANAAPNLQAEVQTALENRIIFLEKRYQALDARLREVEILLGFVVVENSLPIADSQPSTIPDPVPESAAPPSQLPKPSLIYRSNTRYGPNTNYPIATNLVAGETVDVVGYNNDSGTIWFKLASGPWIAAFLVQNAPGSISYIPAPSLEEIENQRSSDLPVDATSDPPTLPSVSPDQSGSSSSQSTQPDVAIQDEVVVNEGGTPPLDTSATVLSTTTVAVTATTDDGSDAPFDDGNSDGMVATAQITTQFDRTTEQASLPDTAPDVSAVVDPNPVRQPVGGVIKPVLSCAGGCTEYPAWCDPPIKGHITFDADEKIYYLPGHLEYGNINMDINYGERWFCSVEEAVEAGWRAP